MNFTEKLTAAQQRNNSNLCIGLDIVLAELPLPLLYADEPMLPFARAIFEATHDLVCAYKIDLAYFFAEGAAGMVALERIAQIVPDAVPLILDLGCSAPAASAAAYARGAFVQYRADAAMLWPQGREDIVDVFLKDNDKSVFVEFPSEEPAYTFHWLNRWQGAYVAGRVGLVAHPHKADGMRLLRSRCPNVPFLMRSSDIGHHLAIRTHGPTKNGIKPIVSVGRELICASKSENYAEDMRQAATYLRDRLNEAE